MFCCFGSACQELILHLFSYGSEGNVPRSTWGCLGNSTSSSSSSSSLSRRACVFCHFFSRFRRDVREFCCRFWTPFRQEIRWCFAVSEAPVRSSFCTYFLMAQKVTFLEVRGAAWVALPAGGFGSNSRQHKLWKNARKKDEQQHQQQQQQQ